MAAASEDALWGAVAAPRPGLRYVIVVPVRNEADHILGTLDALQMQQQVGGGLFDRSAFEILLLANNCDDATAVLARHFGRRHPALQLHVVETRLPLEQAHVGHVRRCLMEEASRRLGWAGSSNGVIVSTDGDTRVAPDWLASTESELAAGADAVGGRILTDGAARSSAAALRIRRLDEAHSLLRSRLASLLDPEPGDPWPRHHQHFGASLAVTVRAYRSIGGLPRVRYLEDEALVRALQGADFRIRHSPAVRVRTSGRLDGRAEVGLSWQLRQWARADASGHDPMVEAPDVFKRRLLLRATLRKQWSEQKPATEQAPAVSRAAAFGAAWAEVDSAWSGSLDVAEKMMPLSRAVAELRDSIRARLAITAC